MITPEREPTSHDKWRGARGELSVKTHTCHTSGALTRLLWCDANIRLQNTCDITSCDFCKVELFDLRSLFNLVASSDAVIRVTAHRRLFKKNNICCHVTQRAADSAVSTWRRQIRASVCGSDGNRYLIDSFGGLLKDIECLCWHASCPRALESEGPKQNTVHLNVCRVRALDCVYRYFF